MSLAEQLGKIASAVDHSQNLYAATFNTINDDVLADR